MKGWQLRADLASQKEEISVLAQAFESVNANGPYCWSHTGRQLRTANYFFVCGKYQNNR